MIKINYPALYRKGERLSSEYKKNKPFPNIVIDNFFNQKTYKVIHDNFPNPNSKIWKEPTNLNTVRKMVTKRGKLNLKEYLFSDTQRRILMELNSSLFLSFLERLTGIQGLLPDPYFAEASFACAKDGGYLNMHADFSHQDKTKLERRVNVLIYLNNDWKKSYNGNLNLYNKNRKLIKKIYPIANRFLAFTTSDHSYHGYPDRIKCGLNKFRKSINMYYYSMPRIKRKKNRVIFPGDPNFKFTPTKD